MRRRLCRRPKPPAAPGSLLAVIAARAAAPQNHPRPRRQRRRSLRRRCRRRCPGRAACRPRPCPLGQDCRRTPHCSRRARLPHRPRRRSRPPPPPPPKTRRSAGAVAAEGEAVCQDDIPQVRRGAPEAMRNSRMGAAAGSRARSKPGASLRVDQDVVTQRQGGRPEGGVARGGKKDRLPRQRRAERDGEGGTGHAIGEGDGLAQRAGAAVGGGWSRRSLSQPAE